MLFRSVPTKDGRTAVEAHQEQILEELNVKSVSFIAADAKLVSYRIKPNLPRVGKRYGKQIPQIKEALARADGAAIAAAQAAGQLVHLQVSGEEIELGPEDLLIETESAEGYACAEDSGMLVALETTLDKALLREGLAREIVRTVQDARKQAGLEVSDRITLHVGGSQAVSDALAAFQPWIMEETLATKWSDQPIDSGFTVEREVGNATWNLSIKKIDA